MSEKEGLVCIKEMRKERSNKEIVRQAGSRRPIIVF
jgi:hypothetical protein